MEEEGKRGAILVDLGLTGQESQTGRMSEVSAVFIMLGHRLFWPSSSVCSSRGNESASFPQQQDWVPRPLPPVST